MLGDVNKLFVFKSLLTTPSNVLPLHLKQTFPPIIWIFTEDEGDGIKSRLPFKIFSTLLKIWSALALDYHFRFGFLDRFEIYVICILLKIKSPQPILPYCTNCSGREGARKKYVLISAGFNIISYLHLIWLRWRPL